MQPSPPRLKEHLLPLALLAAAVLSLFWPVLLHPSYILHPTFSPFSDTMVIHWPKARLMAQSWQAGQGLPHWTPLILSGMPLAANQLAMLSYPPAWLFLIFPIEPTFNVLFIFHLLLGGVGVYVLLREAFGCSPAAALLGGVTFALNGKLLAHAAGGHVSLAGAIGWMPWAVFGLHMLLKAVTRPAWQTAPIRQLPKQLLHPPALLWALLIAVSMAMQIVTHTLPVIYSVYLMGGIAAWHFLAASQGNRFKVPAGPLIATAVYLFLALLLAGLLGAGQLLPLLELVQFSNRSLSLAQAAQYSVTPTQLFIGLFLPTAQGGHEPVIYLGLIPLLLAPLGLTRRNRWAWFYAGVLAFAILFALGPSTPVHSFFYHFVPGFRWVRTPARIFFVGAMATAVLVGFAVDRLAAANWSPKQQTWLTRAGVAAGGLALMLGLGLALGFGQTGRATFALAILVPLGVGLILLRARGIISAPAATALLGVALFADLAGFGTSMMRFVPLQKALAPGRPAAEYLAQKPGLFRVYSPSYSLPVQTAAAHNLHLADGVEPVHLAIYDQFMARAGGYNDASFSVTIPNFGDAPLETALQDVEPDLKLLGLLNVDSLASAFPMEWPGLTLDKKIGNTYIYANEQAMPRAWVAHQAIPAEADWLAQLEETPNLDEVVIVGSQAAGRPPSAVRRPPSPARVTHYSADLIEIETRIDQPGWLVLSEIWYPGWQATVNGRPQPVAKVNGLLRGVYLSTAGQHRVIIAYTPASVVWGNWIAGLTIGLGILAGLGWLGLKKAAVC